jgi:hypothetical protein
MHLTEHMLIHLLTLHKDEIMSAVSDLTAAVDELSDAIAAELKALTTALSFVGQDAAIEASVARLHALTGTLKASVPAPAPAPVEAPAAPVA